MRKKVKVKEVSNFIEEYKQFLLEEKVFSSYDELVFFFTMGGCYIFARILSRQFDLPIAMSQGKCHCGVYMREGLFTKYFFDITGFRTNSTYGFWKAEKHDIEYIEKMFGFKSYPSENFEEFFVKDTRESFNNKTHPNVGTITMSNYRKESA